MKARVSAYWFLAVYLLSSLSLGAVPPMNGWFWYIANSIATLNVQNETSPRWLTRTVWFKTDGSAWLLSEGSFTGSPETESKALSPRPLGRWSLESSYNSNVAYLTTSAFSLGGTQTRFKVTQYGSRFLLKMDVEHSSGITVVGDLALYVPSTLKFTNQSARVPTAPGGKATLGLIITGEQRWLVIRAMSGSLKRFGLQTCPQGPSLTVFAAGQKKIAAGEVWNANEGTRQFYTEVFAMTGAIPLDENAGEHVAFVKLGSGAFTVECINVSDRAGECMIEVFEMPYALRE